MIRQCPAVSNPYLVQTQTTLPWWSEDELFAPMFKQKVDVKSNDIGYRSMHSTDSEIGKSGKSIIDYFSDTNTIHFDDSCRKGEFLSGEFLSSEFRSELFDVEEGGKLSIPSTVECSNEMSKKSSMDFFKRPSLAEWITSGIRNRARASRVSAVEKTLKKAAPRSPARVEPKVCSIKWAVFLQLAFLST